VLTPPIPVRTDPPRHPLAFRVTVEVPGLAAAVRPDGAIRVRLRVDVREDGTVARASVTVSSGRQDLDGAAVRAAQSWQFVPAKRDGSPIASVVLVWVAFVMEP